MNKDIKIMIVEDTDIQRGIWLIQLNDLGFTNIIEKVDGLEALSYLEENPVDLIISDLMMPNLDGLGLLKKIKKNPSLQNIPFIMLTIDEKIISDVMDAGAADFITKPATSEILKEKIEKIFG